MIGPDNEANFARQIDPRVSLTPSWWCSKCNGYMVAWLSYCRGISSKFKC